MSKRTRRLAAGLGAIVVAAAAVCLVVSLSPEITAEDILASFRGVRQYAKLTIEYPLDETQ